MEGGEIPMYYDSMIAKFIVHGRDQGHDAISGKCANALNGFRDPRGQFQYSFPIGIAGAPRLHVTGNFNTGFIAEHFGKGFHAEDVPHSDPDFLVALAAFVRRKSRERAASLSGQLPGYDVKVGQTYTVITLNAQGEHHFDQVEVDDAGGLGTAVIKLNGKNFAIHSNSRLNDMCH